jgi:hypothetical protein
VGEFSLSIGLFYRAVNRSEPGAPFTYAKRRHIVGGSRGPSGAPPTRGLPGNTVTTRVSGIETIIGSANDPGLRDDQTRVWVGKNYIEVDVAPGADVPIYEMVPISEIASVSYF